MACFRTQILRSRLLDVSLTNEKQIIVVAWPHLPSEYYPGLFPLLPGMKQGGYMLCTCRATQSPDRWKWRRLWEMSRPELKHRCARLRFATICSREVAFSCCRDGLWVGFRSDQTQVDAGNLGCLRYWSNIKNKHYQWKLVTKMLYCHSYNKLLYYQNRTNLIYIIFCTQLCECFGVFEIAETFEHSQIRFFVLPNF